MNLLILKTTALISIVAFVAAIPPLMLTCLELKMRSISLFFSLAAALFYAVTVAKASRAAFAGARGYVIEDVATFAYVRGKVCVYLGILYVLTSVALISLASQYGAKGFLGAFAPNGCVGMMGAMLTAVSFMPTALKWILEDRFLARHDSTIPSRGRNQDTQPTMPGTIDIAAPSSAPHDKVRD